MSKTLYVSDMDGTLLNSASEVSASTRDMLNRAIAAGAQFTVATARTPATVSRLLEGVDMQLPAVVMTGAALWSPRTNRYSDVKYIPIETVDGMIEVYRRYGLPTFVYRLEDNRIVLYHYGPFTADERDFLMARIGNPFKRFDNERCDIDGMPVRHDDVVLFYAMQPNDDIARVDEALSDLPVRATVYHDMYGPETAMLEVFAEGTSKAEAVRRLAENIGADRIVVFGDNLNDLPMMQVADVAVAVGNAIDPVREAADVIIGDHDSDAVARFILDDMQ